MTLFQILMKMTDIARHEELQRNLISEFFILFPTFKTFSRVFTSIQWNELFQNLYQRKETCYLRIIPKLFKNLFSVAHISVNWYKHIALRALTEVFELLISLPPPHQTLCMNVMTFSNNSAEALQRIYFHVNFSF